MDATEMGKRSQAAQRKKYGGKASYRKELKRRSTLALEKRWAKKK